MTDAKAIQRITIGEEAAVVVPLSTWERILDRLEEIEDIEAFDRSARDRSSTIDHADLCRRIGRSPLRYLRSRAGVTQADLARKAGLSQSFIAKVESGEKKLSPSSRTGIAKILKVQPGDLDY